MKFSQLFGVVLAGVVLGGCTKDIRDTDAGPEFAKFTVDKSAQDLYFELTTPTIDDPVCNGVFRNSFYEKRGEFRIYFGLKPSLFSAPPSMIISGVYGKAVGDKTEVIVRDPQFGLAHAQFNRKITNYIKTGRCKE